MRYRNFLYMGILIISFLLAGCGRKESKITVEEPREEDKIQIACCFDNFVVERWQRDRDVFVSTAQELGAEVNVQNGNGDAQEQIKQIEYFIDKKVDVLVVVPIDSYSLTEVIKKAKNAGIKVISYDRLALEAAPDLYISVDNEMVGKLMGTEMAKVLKKGDKIIMICGPSEDNNVSYVERGFREAISEKGIVVADMTYIDNWKADLAGQYVAEHLEEIREVQGIMCGNDDIASQVVQVLAENQLAGNVVVVGQDGDLAACQRIVEGTQYMTAFKPIEDLARKAAKYAVEMGSGKGVAELEDVTETVNDGTYEIPSCILEPTAVTKENIDKVIIEGGFHRRDEVYLNADYS
mgnify:CR=1 FL=1